MNTTPITIVGFNPGLAEAFRQLNLAWLIKYFNVEPLDEQVLSNPKKEILDKGGFIYFMMAGDDVVGTFALIKVNESVYELAKMAVDEKWQGRKIGHAILEYCITIARQIEAQKVILYSNTLLQPAIHLYKKHGFIQVPLVGAEYKRANIKMEIDLT